MHQQSRRNISASMPHIGATLTTQGGSMGALNADVLETAFDDGATCQAFAESPKSWADLEQASFLSAEFQAKAQPYACVGPLHEASVAF